MYKKKRSVEYNKFCLYLHQKFYLQLKKIMFCRIKNAEDEVQLIGML